MLKTIAVLKHSSGPVKHPAPKKTKHIAAARHATGTAWNQVVRASSSVGHINKPAHKPAPAVHESAHSVAATSSAVSEPDRSPWELLTGGTVGAPSAGGFAGFGSLFGAFRFLG
jgi:hypothetical protein